MYTCCDHEDDSTHRHRLCMSLHTVHVSGYYCVCANSGLRQITYYGTLADSNSFLCMYL